MLNLQVNGVQMDFSNALKKFCDEDVDVYGYAGPIEKSGYDDLCDEIAETPKRSKALLYLCTGGGNPNAGYRIARAMAHHYGADNFRVAIPAECKSAGTLVCIGAHSLVMFDKGELGPLDVQFQKQDEIFQQSSGLDILRGINYLQKDALESFNSYLYDINAGSGMSTRVASEIASKLVIGLYEPVFAQVDPIRLGEMSAALQIAHEYGTRLNEAAKNLKESGISLNKLVNTYPTHGFVIDRAEARKLFERVDAPEAHEVAFGPFVVDVMWKRGRVQRPGVVRLSKLFEDTLKEKNATSTASGSEQSSENATNHQQPDGQFGEGSSTVSGQHQPHGSSQSGDSRTDQGNVVPISDAQSD